MDTAQSEGGDSLCKDNNSRPTTSGHASNEAVPEKNQIESVCDGEEGDAPAVSTFSEITPVIASDECKDESQLPFSSDYEESLIEISEGLFESSKSEAVDAKRESHSEAENTKPSHSQSGSETEIKNQPNACNTTVYQEKTISKTKKQEKMSEVSARKRRESKDHCCQATYSPDNASEVTILKEKLAISKKDTETMQKLLEDVRKDYEELQKSFEKRESDVKSKVFAEELTKENDETRKEKADLKRGKSLRRGNKVLASDDRNESRSSEKRKPGLEKGTASEVIDAGEVACPCFVQSIRKIVTDVREEFKDTISVFKQSSAEHCASIGKELTKLKDEYLCALEKKDSEIHIFEEVTKSLQSRVLEAEQDAVTLRAAISCSFEEKQKLHDDFRRLKDELLRKKHESETSQANLEKMKHGLKRYCTAEEYEELQRSNFKFSGDPSINVDSGQASECKMDDNVSELKNKVAKFYPVLKKAKKEITRLKEEKQDLENRLQQRISEAEVMEGYLSKQLNEALSEVKQKERGVSELTEQLVTLKVENAKLNAKADELEEEKEDLYKRLEQELEVVKCKLKKSDESLQFHKVKSDHLQQENDVLNDGYLELKNYLENEQAKMLVGTTQNGEYLSDDEDSVGKLLKDESLLQKQLKVEKEKNELCLKEIESLKKEIDQWKKMVRDDMDTGLGFLRIENEELKDEIQENHILIKQLVEKKKMHIRIIKKLRVENDLLKSARDTGTDEYEDISLDSGDGIDSEEPGYDRTTTQEHRVRFDKNGKIEKTECSDDDEDSLFNTIKHGVHFPDDDNDLHNDSSLEILEYDDTSITEKE